MNPRPSKCESDALPAELRPLVFVIGAGRKQRLFSIGRLHCIVDRKKEIKDFPLVSHELKVAAIQTSDSVAQR